MPLPGLDVGHLVTIVAVLLLYALLLTGVLGALITPPYLYLSWLLTR